MFRIPQMSEQAGRAIREVEDRSAPSLAQPRIVSEPRNLTVDIYRALADPIRLELLARIAASGPVCVCHLEEELPYSQSRISKHLATLRRVGLVLSRREGNWVYYSANGDALDTAREFIDQLGQSMRTPHEANYCPPPDR
jgi:ArsR family transcriptional regulator, arsenate/arsenite/antimonite-responsive transcriptional repressor